MALPHLGGGFGSHFAAVQPDEALDGLAQPVRKKTFAQRPQQLGKEKIAQSFRRGFRQAVLRGFAVEFRGNAIPFLLCRSPSKDAGCFLQQVFHEFLLAGPIGHAPGSRHSRGPARYRTGSQRCRNAGANTGCQRRKAVRHGDHGIRHAVKGFSLILLRIGGLFASALFPLLQGFGIRHVNVAAIPCVAYGVGHAAGEHGQPLANGQGGIAEPLQKAAFLRRRLSRGGGFRRPGRPLRKIDIGKIEQVILIVGLCGAVGFSGHSSLRRVFSSSIA